MPRKRKYQHSPAPLNPAPEPIASALEKVIEKAGLTTAGQLAEIQEAARRLGVSGDTPAFVDLELPTHAGRARPKPSFSPVPEGFAAVASYPHAGVKVLRSFDRSVAAIQFAEDRVPTREEKDRMQMAGVRYDERNRQWQREDRERPGANITNMGRIGGEIAEARMGRGR